MLPVTEKEKQSYEKRKLCHLYEFDDKLDDNHRKVRDHSHYTGK